MRFHDAMKGVQTRLLTALQKLLSGSVSPSVKKRARKQVDELWDR